MAINSMDKNEIIRSTLDGFRVRVQAHYEDLNEVDLKELEDVLDAILSPKVSDAAIQNRQYNPKTDEVEDIA